MSNLLNSQETDLSAGSTNILDDMLSLQRQKRRFRSLSFYAAWSISLLFFISVIIFSWSIIFCPNVFLGTEKARAIPARQSLQISEQEQSTKNNPLPQQSTSTLPQQEQHQLEKSKTETTSPLLNQFLILLALLSAVGSTLAIAVMRFSFYEKNDTESENPPAVISPIADAASQLISQIAELLKKR